MISRPPQNKNCLFIYYELGTKVKGGANLPNPGREREILTGESGSLLFVTFETYYLTSPLALVEVVALISLQAWLPINLSWREEGRGCSSKEKKYLILNPQRF